MSTKLTVIRNNKKLASSDLNKMKNALSYSKEDTNLYFFILSAIVDNHPSEKIKMSSWKYLVKQDKLQNILDELISRTDALIIEWNDQVSSESASCYNVMQQVNQLEKEIRIFNEIHFTVKRAYIRFTTEHFQNSWKTSEDFLKVA